MLDEFTVFAFPSRSLRQAKTSINSITYAVNSSVLRLSSVDWVGDGTLSSSMATVSPGCQSGPEAEWNGLTALGGLAQRSRFGGTWQAMQALAARVPAAIAAAVLAHAATAACRRRNGWIGRERRVA
jgi:hypothetical protein